MFRSILVPLDGSPLSHQAIVPAGDIARRLKATLAFAVVHPWEALENAPFAGTEADDSMLEEEQRYLDEIWRRVSQTFRVPADTVLLEGDATTALSTFAGDRGIDLVVSSTHGRGAVARALRGSVALPLAHAIACPVVLLKPDREATVVDPDGFTSILVPLDGSPAAEASIEPALALAADRRVRLHLLHVASPFEAHGHLLERRRDAARYLNAVADPLERRGIRVDCRVVTRAKPGAVIASLAAKWGVDLVAITTRERGEGTRMLLGSVADTVVHLAGMPVMICHATARQRATEAVAGVAWRPALI